ncbi:hypothetical protein B0T21DRAFT_389603 [Apiosordaria backusii]|uniref:Uncharacterized protein n=1 Tax=Apiosordaria backusii TaxID=314023 RepID=A0AA40F0G5_9PEZI|nr:hypothetical protein B0T21DRAFT_389603 [Apiosordaria backusii]
MSGTTPTPTTSAFEIREEDRRRRRRSSTFSGYSWSEAGRDLHDEILDPGPVFYREETSWRTALPIVFAILPATVGLVFKNGSSFITDVILLGLMAVFLHWSVTAPWKWYHASQQLREEEESVFESAFHDDSASDTTTGPQQQQQPATNATESAESAEAQNHKLDRRAEIARAALRKLGWYEVGALAACFIAPAMATYMLHCFRDLLSRDSEGLVSNFNLVIFLLAAEISPLGHSIKLIQANTLHLQRLVHSNNNPYRQEKVTLNQWKELIARLDELETRWLTQQQQQQSQQSEEQQQQNGNGNVNGSVGNVGKGIDTRQVHASLVREVRNQIQPEIDALNRAVRRYEKKARVLAVQTEQRLRDLGQRVDDAISLSAVVAGRKNGGGFGEWDVGGGEGVGEGVGGIRWLFGMGGDEDEVMSKKRDGDGLRGYSKERSWQRSGGGSGSGNGSAKGYLGRRRLIINVFKKCVCGGGEGGELCRNAKKGGNMLMKRLRRVETSCVRYLFLVLSVGVSRIGLLLLASRIGLRFVENSYVNTSDGDEAGEGRSDASLATGNLER